MLSQSATRTSVAEEPVRLRRHLRRNERRERVYTVAITLFTERGYDGTTMDDIASRAGVARTSVFNYFERKSTFLEDWAARRRDRGFESIRNGDELLRERLLRFMSAMADVNTSSRGETVALFGPAVRELNLLDNSDLAMELTDLIVASGEPVSDPSLLGSVLATGYFAVLHDWCAEGAPPFDLAQRLRQLVHLVADGFARQ